MNSARTLLTDLLNRFDRLTQAAKDLSEATGGTCLPVQADVRQPKTLEDAVRKTIEKFGRIDFVICGTHLITGLFRDFTYSQVRPATFWPQSLAFLKMHFVL